MALTFSIQEINGPAGSKTYTTVTEVRFGTKDQVDPIQAGTLNDFYPIPIPSSGLNYSFWKSICGDLSGTFTDFRNLRVYFTDPAWNLGTGGAKIIGNRDTGDIGCPDANYQQASGTDGQSGDAIDDATNGHAYYNGQTTPTKNWADWTSSAPGTVDSNPYTSPGKTQHVVLQVSVGPGADGSLQTGGQMTFRYQLVN